MTRIPYIATCPCGSKRLYRNCCKSESNSGFTQSPEDKARSILPDWRIATIVQTAKDIPGAYPGGPSHPKGSYLAMSHEVEHPLWGRLGFISPHPAALALSISLGAAAHARQLQSKLVLQRVPSPAGGTASVAPGLHRLLFDFFEHCMTSVTFAYQAIESYCNSVIPAFQVTYLVQRDKRFLKMSPSEVERKCSTPEKVSTIVPWVLQVSSPKGVQLWTNFKTLQRIRDAVIHMKYHDIYNIADSAKEAPYFDFFDLNPFVYPRYAFDILWYFSQTTNDRLKRPEWIRRFIHTIGPILEDSFSVQLNES